jgi:hypothetical protein
MTYAELLQTRSREQADIWLKLNRKDYIWVKGKLTKKVTPPEDPAYDLPIVPVTAKRKYLTGVMHYCRYCDNTKDGRYFPKHRKDRCFKCKYKASKDYLERRQFGLTKDST